MKSTSFLSLASLATLGSCYANIPAGLVDLGIPELTLDAIFPLTSWPCGKKPYVTFKPGQTLTSSDTANAPIFNTNSAPFTSNSTEKYVFLMVDPSTNTTDSYAVALHAMYANVTATSNGTVVAPFIYPIPDTVAPHNYTLLLFAQPSDEFVVPEQYQSWLPLNYSDLYARLNFPIVDFLRDTGLGKPVAGNWFKQGMSTSNSSSSAVASLCSATTPAASSSAASTRPYASATPIIINATVTPTGTGGIVPSRTTTSTGSTGTATSTSPSLAGAAAVSDASIGNVLLALGAVVAGFGML